jgi:hypothetical protein
LQGALLDSRPFVMNRQQGRKESAYRLEILERVPAFTRRARRKPALEEGQLVYYGPTPMYYGVGEVKRVVGALVAVDFRGTGTFGVHEELLEVQYLARIPPNIAEDL